MMTNCGVKNLANLSNMFCLIAERGFTAKKIADATGISTGNISDWKSGRSSPSVLKLEQIADFLDCSIDYLIGRTDQPDSVSKIREEDQDLLATVHQLDARDQGKVLGYAESLLSADKYSVKDASRRA